MRLCRSLREVFTTYEIQGMVTVAILMQNVLVMTTVSYRVEKGAFITFCDVFNCGECGDSVVEKLMRQIFMIGCRKIFQF